jgi:cysteine desulfurase/selenocysteine lyase
MVAEVTNEKTFYRSDVKVFEAGTQNISGVIGTGSAIKYLESIGMDKIFSHTKEITKYLIEQLKEINLPAGRHGEVKIFTEENIDKNIGIVSFTYDKVHAHDVAEILGRLHIAVRAGHHCAEPFVKSLGEDALVRVSIYLYTTKEDIDKLILGLKEVKKIFKI